MRGGVARAAAVGIVAGLVAAGLCAGFPWQVHPQGTDPIPPGGTALEVAAAQRGASVALAKRSGGLVGLTVARPTSPAAFPTPLAATMSDAPSAGPAGFAQAVGALFPAGGSEHTCSASVVDSPAGDLLLTAAHCITGTGAGMTFAPSYAGGAARFGSWTVTAAYAPAGWLAGQDPREDFAVLVVAPQPQQGAAGVPIEQAVGAYEAGTAPQPGEVATVAAYNLGSGDLPVVCRATTYEADGFPAFDCPDYGDGTSGGPWLTTDPTTGRTEVTGVIGGLNQGGCTDSTSYSSPFEAADLEQLLAAAQSGVAGQVLPQPGSDGC